MKKQISVRIKPSESVDQDFLEKLIKLASGLKESSMVTGYHILKKSIDARSRQVYVNLTLEAFIDEPFEKRKIKKIILPDVRGSNQKIIIVGTGPAGLFAAIQLIEKGIKPVLLERGKDVKSRRRDLARLNKDGIINPDSNYCFGEGGAGTYSDGKLYTRSSKRGDVNRILNILVQFGADEKILYESHPHIGTNKLPHIITAIREKIMECGGEIHFNNKVTDLIVEKDKVSGVKTSDNNFLSGNAVILATGHSARDIFYLLDSKKIKIEFKPFALGVRVEHPQALIDSIQYHCAFDSAQSKRLNRGSFLPPASYSLVEQVDGKGVFSFCMCPGGIIAPAATDHEELVVNGWSPSKRNNPYANSGIVVAVDEKNISRKNYLDPLSGVKFQKKIERKAFILGGGKFMAPAQRLVDFCTTKNSTDLPDCSYIPGVRPAMLKEVLPPFIHDKLQSAFKLFGNKMRGYYTNDAIVVATESRTSSPVRLPRDPEFLHHPQLHNLFPCGEGAGYAGGIVSAAMDGERIAKIIAQKFT